MAQPIGYEFAGMTFCPLCAYKNSVIPLVISGLGYPEDMDDVIARMTLAQIENGMPIDTPVPVVTSEQTDCDNCGKVLAPAEVA